MAQGEQDLVEDLKLAKKVKKKNTDFSLKNSLCILFI